MTPALWLQELSIWSSAISAFFTMATAFVAGWAVWKTLPQFQRTKRAERKAEVAEALWGAVFRLARALHAMTHPGMIVNSDSRESDEAENRKSRGERFLEDRAEQWRQVGEFSKELLTVWGLAELHFDTSVTQAVERFWKVRARVLVDFNGYARSLDMPGAFLEAGKRLFDGEDYKAVEACEEELKRILGPIARHELEHAVLALPVAAPSPVSPVEATSPVAAPSPVSPVEATSPVAAPIVGNKTRT